MTSSRQFCQAGTNTSCKTSIMYNSGKHFIKFKFFTARESSDRHSYERLKTTKVSKSAVFIAAYLKIEPSYLPLPLVHPNIVFAIFAKILLEARNCVITSWERKSLTTNSLFYNSPKRMAYFLYQMCPHGVMVVVVIICLDAQLPQFPAGTFLDKPQ